MNGTRTADLAAKKNFFGKKAPRKTAGRAGERCGNSGEQHSPEDSWPCGERCGSDFPRTRRILGILGKSRTTWHGARSLENSIPSILSILSIPRIHPLGLQSRGGFCMISRSSFARRSQASSNFRRSAEKSVISSPGIGARYRKRFNSMAIQSDVWK